MDFALSTEQAELVSTVRSVLDRKGSPRVDDPALWSTLVEVGVAALAIPEEYDGAGATFFETALVLEELGRSLVPSPLLATTIATEALLAGGTDGAKRELLPRIAAGAVATLVPEPDRPALEGDRAEITLAIVGDELVDTFEPQARWVESMDQTLRLATVSPGWTTVIGDGAAARERADLAAAASTAALAVGLCQRALDMTVAYTKERVQFGRPIGSFQGLKHRMADMLVRTELARSLSWSASYAFGVRGADAPQQVHAAASYAVEAARHLAAECIQLHGGIAITWEHDAHLVFKRAHALGHLFETPAAHRAALAL